MNKFSIVPWLISSFFNKNGFSRVSTKPVRTQREEVLSVVFIVFLCLIIFSMIIFSLFYIGKGYLTYLQSYENETLLSVVSFVIVGGVSFLTLLLFMKRNSAKLSLQESSESLFFLDNQKLLKLGSCFLNGFLESILGSMKTKT